MKRWISSLTIVLALSMSAADNVGWHEVKQGETLESITKHYLGTSASWRENWKLNPDLKNPNLLRPGQRIRVILSQTLPARSAEVSKVTRKVERKPEPAPWVVANAGDQLKERHGIRTFEKSSAELLFDDRTTLTLTEDSLVFLREAKALPKKRDRSTIEIVDGQADLEKPARAARAHDIEIVVGSATAKPSAAPGERSTARLRNDNGAARLMAYRGGAALSSGGATVAVPQGMGSSAPAGGGPPTKPENLLPAPNLDPMERGSTRPRFTWQPVDGAATYTVEVCSDEHCSRLIDRATALTMSRWQPAKPLPAGETYWRATARSATALDGYPSKAQKLWVGFGIAGVLREQRFSEGSPAETHRTIVSRPLGGATLILYRDGGDGLPSGDDDTRVTSVVSGTDGVYEFGGLPAGAYWVTVDSRTLGAGWAEQTSAPMGGLCADGHGGTEVLELAGPCFGGRRAAVSDDAASLASSEHLSLVRVGEDDVQGIDFGFSFDTVTHTRDGDDDPTSPLRAIQGSVRQFLLNAAAMPGRNEMNFVPTTVPERNGENSSRWWVVHVVAPLPEVVNADTVLDGKAFSHHSGTIPVTANPTSIAEVQPGGSSIDRQFVGTDGIPLRHPEDVELEIDFTEPAGEGLVLGASATVRRLALHGAKTNLRVEAAARIEDLIVGLHADRSMAEDGAGGTGILVTGHGAAMLRRVVVAEMASNGVLVTFAARIDAEHLEVRHCGLGDPTGDGLALHSNDSRVAFSLFHQSSNDGIARADGGSGIEIRAGREDGAASASRNEVQQSTVSDNRKGITISGDATSNRITTVVFEGNQLAGVVMSAENPEFVPRRNTLSMNRFDGLAARAIDIDHRFGMTDVGDGPDAPLNDAAECAGERQSPNENIRPPRFTSVVKVEGGYLIDGLACTGDVVEIYTESDNAWQYERQIRVEAGAFNLFAVSDRVAALAIGPAGSSELVALGSQQ